VWKHSETLIVNVENGAVCEDGIKVLLVAAECAGLACNVLRPALQQQKACWDTAHKSARQPSLECNDLDAFGTM
jgi:hypothetical protein